MSPSFVGIVPSIEMVIFAAVGGRMSLRRRGLRHAAGQLRKDLILRAIPGAVAVPDGRRCSSPWCMLFPNGLAGLVGDRLMPRRGTLPRGRPAHGNAPNPAAAPKVRRSRHAAARDGGKHAKPMLTIEELSVSFDGFKAVDDLNFYVDSNELRVDDRPERRRQDHGAGPDLRQDRGDRGHDQVQGQELTQHARSTRSCAPASGANSRRRPSTKT